MNSLFETVLYIPEGINFDCTGCGNCCFHWPVPATDADVERITALAGDSDKPNFRRLPNSVDKMKAFTHALEKKSDGSCQYLDADIRCRLHKNFGIESKPAMCRLFPYTFTNTPSGTFASVSFASTGVLLNSGSPLTLQKEFLQQQLSLFTQLFPNQPDWSQIQLVDGVSMRWVEFLSIDKVLLENICPGKTLTREVLLAQSRFIVGKISKPVDLDNAHLTKVRPILIDQILLKLLYELYFVADPYDEGVAEFDHGQFMDLLAQPAPSLSMRFHRDGAAAELVSFKAINDRRYRTTDYEQLEQLLTRFVYCRLFSKLYFGPGFGGLSLLSGYHHLIVLVALVRIHLKMANISAVDTSDFQWQLEQIRMLERRLTVASLSREAHAILEVLLQSPARVERILSLSV
ncbi:MAG: YkgJ family cysteine cluster protein [Cyanobacteria bacterium SZAS LIN-5]|nr:YkgJ family cysteine cluster protein [Cyanobacteria bacterium SZAS LIN-5]